jgi:hypothetical protein
MFRSCHVFFACPALTGKVHTAQEPFAHTMQNTSLFNRYAAAIEALDLARIKTPSQIPSSFRLGGEGSLSSSYVPFDFVNRDARLVVVGITPGFTQWKNAMREAQIQLRSGATADAALHAAKQTGAFSGAMRPNLIALLDHIGLNGWLGLPSCEALFSSAGHLIQTTSILRHRVFVDGVNYSGAPAMNRTPFLQRQIEEHFAVEAASLRHAVFVPLGPTVSEGLEWLRPFKSWGGRFRLTALAYAMVAGSVLFVARCRPGDATALHSPCREAAILNAEMRWDENSPFKTATLTCAMQCAPSSAQRICRFLAIRWLTTWFTADSAMLLLIGRPLRCRAP